MLKQGKETGEQQAAREAKLQTELGEVEAAVAILRADFSEERACYSVQMHMLRSMISALEIKGGMKALAELRGLLGSFLGMVSTLADGMGRAEGAEV